MSDNWFRGEGVSVQPAKVGAVINDIGDGMYLTDRLDVAKQYAQERASNPTDRRVYSVPVDRSGLRVLDLTTDMRWKKMMDMPIPSQSGETIETMMKRQPASQQYKAMFDSFVKNNKINLDNFDAVIGHEYRSGGKQMCILYKNRQPSPIQMTLRGSFVPIGAMALPKTPPGGLRFGGKIGPGLKVAGGTFIVIAVQLLIQWLTGKIDAERQKEALKKKMEAHRSAIEADVKRNKQSALTLLAEGKKAFATVRISTTKTNIPQISAIPMGGVEILNIDLDLDYLGLKITDKEENKPDGEESGILKDMPLLSAGTYYKNFYLMSFALTFTDEEINLYRNFLKEIKWYEAQIESSPSAEDSQRLSADRDKLFDKLNASLTE